MNSPRNRQKAGVCCPCWCSEILTERESLYLYIIFLLFENVATWNFHLEISFDRTLRFTADSTSALCTFIKLKYFIYFFSYNISFLISFFSYENCFPEWCTFTKLDNSENIRGRISENNLWQMFLSVSFL